MYDERLGEEYDEFHNSNLYLLACAIASLHYFSNVSQWGLWVYITK
jgi:hypothetical protein